MTTMLVLAREPFATQLRVAGIVALPMHGPHELRSEAVAEVIAALGPETVGVMIDNGVAVPGRSRSPELTQFERFSRAARDHGMLIVPVGLSRPDIIAYLNPKAVAQACHKESIDWGSLTREFRDSGKAGFKHWLADPKLIDVSHGGRIQEALDLMEEHCLPFESVLTRKLEEFISTVTS